MDVEEGVKRVDEKISELEGLMKNKVDQLDNIMNLLENKNISEDVATTVGNVRDILNKDVSSEIDDGTKNKTK